MIDTYRDMNTFDGLDVQVSYQKNDAHAGYTDQ